MSVILSRLVTLTAGTLYPAYRSYKAVRTKDTREYVKWMMYWIVFAIYCFVETIADILIAFWFPFYYQLKIVFVFWLLSPWTKGASILYRKWIHPTLTKHERGIDAMLEQAKSESYNQVLRIGSRTLLCARDIVAEAAIRGQQQLVTQIQRSYSVSDVSTVTRKPFPLVEHIEEMEDDIVPSAEENEADEDYEAPRRRRRSRPRTVDPTEPTYNTMPRRNPRRHAAL